MCLQVAGLAEPAITAKVDVQPVEAILGPIKVLRQYIHLSDPAAGI